MNRARCSRRSETDRPCGIPSRGNTPPGRPQKTDPPPERERFGGGSSNIPKETAGTSRSGGCKRRRKQEAEAAESAKGRDGRFGRVNVCGSTQSPCSFEGAGRGSERSFPAEKFPVTIAGGHHLYPYRTQKLSLQTLMVLSWERLGRVGSCRDPRGAGGTKVFPAPKT